jgi:hypothetical protein
MDYNEHYYFETLEEALGQFNTIKEEIIQFDSIVEVYTDEDDEFYIQESDGAVKVYIQEI